MKIEVFTGSISQIQPQTFAPHGAMKSSRNQCSYTLLARKGFLQLYLISYSTNFEMVNFQMN